MWKSLQRIAILGLEKGNLSEEEKSYLAGKYGIPLQASETRFLLDAIAILGQQKKATLPLKLFEGMLPSPQEDGSMDAVAPRDCLPFIMAILKGPFQNAWKELVALLRQKALFFPPEALPALFECCLQEPCRWKEVQNFLNASGRWVLEQNPRWEVLRQDQAMTISQAQGAWNTYSWKEKSILLKSWHQTIDAKDEPFLLQVLGDSRKEVRCQAALLLMQLPTSAFARDIFTCLSACCVLHDGLLVIDPTFLSIRPQIMELFTSTAQQNYHPGPKANIFFQLWAKVPPDSWLALFPLQQPHQVVEIFDRSEYSSALVHASADASVFHRHPGWAQALISWVLRQKSDTRSMALPLSGLLELLSDAAFNDTLMPVVQGNTTWVREKSMVDWVLQKSTHWWSRQVCRLILDSFRHWYVHLTQMDWSREHYRNLLAKVAFRADLQDLALFTDILNHFSPAAYHWSKEIEKVREVMEFRQKLGKVMLGD